jgi:hypothetical protein
VRAAGASVVEVDMIAIQYLADLSVLFTRRAPAVPSVVESRFEITNLHEPGDG